MLLAIVLLNVLAAAPPTATPATGADITASADNQVLARTSGALAFGAVTGAMMTNNTVGNAQLRQSWRRNHS